MQIISPAFNQIENSPAIFEATGKLIVNNVDDVKDNGLYQCLVNDAAHTKLASLNVQRIFGE